MKIFDKIINGKSWLLSLKLNLLLALSGASLLFFLPSVFATEVEKKMWVESVSGSVFAQRNGDTIFLKKGHPIADLTDIVTEINSEVIIRDNLEHRYHLAGSSYLKVLNKILELKEGSIRLVSLNTIDEFEIHTANAVIKYKKVDGILTFDSDSGRSQVLVLNGNFHFSNQQDKDNYIIVESGLFSFIKNDLNEGFPRKPTPIGKGSFFEMASIFKLSPSGQSHDIDHGDTRQIASIHGKMTPNSEITITDFNNYSPKAEDGEEGKIIFTKINKKLSQPIDLKKIYMTDIKDNNEIKRINTPPPFSKRTHVPLKIFGNSGHDSASYDRSMASFPLKKGNKKASKNYGLHRPDLFVKLVPNHDDQRKPASLNNPLSPKAEIKKSKHQKSIRVVSRNDGKALEDRHSPLYIEQRRQKMEADDLMQRLKSTPEKN